MYYIQIVPITNLQQYFWMLFMWVWCFTYIRVTAEKKKYNVNNTADVR